MSRWSNQQVFNRCERFAGVGKVHWKRRRRIPFAGQTGHYYFLRDCTTPISFDEMAQMTRLSGNAEVSQMRVNDAYFIYVANRGIAAGTIWLPLREEGIEEVEWIAHTHPREQENDQERIIEGPTRSDMRTIDLLASRWNQTESTIVNCRGGRVVRTVVFRPEPDFESGRLTFTPSP